MDIRYVGQEFYLNTPVTYHEVLSADRDGIRRHFDALHLRHYGQNAEHRPVEVVNIRANAIGERAKMEFKSGTVGGATAKPTHRDVYLSDAKKPTRCAIYQRDALSPGAKVQGPAIIEESATTALLQEGDEATICPTGEIIITIGGN
jgi:N-methylhydantoinase A